MEINQFYIAGKFITPDGKEVIELINPATEQKVGHVISGSKKDVNEAVTAAQHAFQDASALSIEEKKTIPLVAFISSFLSPGFRKLHSW